MGVPMLLMQLLLLPLRHQQPALDASYLAHLPAPELGLRAGEHTRLVVQPTRRPGRTAGQGGGQAGSSHRPVALFTTCFLSRHRLHTRTLPEQSPQRGSSQRRHSPFTTDIS